MNTLERKTGLTYAETGAATAGFTLFSPINQKRTILVNMRGEVVHEWALPAPPGNYA